MKTVLLVGFLFVGCIVVLNACRGRPYLVPRPAPRPVPPPINLPKNLEFYKPVEFKNFEFKNGEFKPVEFKPPRDPSNHYKNELPKDSAPDKPIDVPKSVHVVHTGHSSGASDSNMGHYSGRINLCHAVHFLWFLVRPIIQYLTFLN